MMERPSELRLGLPCPRCGRSLLPVSTDASVTFHCKNGHELSMLELLTAQSSALRAGLEALLTEWNVQYDALIRTVEDARAHGYLNVAEIFQRHAKSLESRMDLLRSAYSKADSSHRLKVPESLKSL